jgi:hypothetical protein
MPTLEQIAIALATFDALTEGEPGAPLVLLCRDRCNAGAPVAALGDMGCAIAPAAQLFAGARPDPREFSNYLIDRLMDDAMAVLRPQAMAMRGFTWSAMTGAAASPGGCPPPRTAGLAHTSSRPHPNAFNRAANGRRRSGAPRPQGIS